MVRGAGASNGTLDDTDRRGRSTRHRILDTTTRLAISRGNAEPSVAEIAKAAGVFPNQITYHFGSKQALLIDAAFLGLLRDAGRIELVGRRAPTPSAFRRGIARAVLSMPTLPGVARVLAAEIAKPQHGSTIDAHMQLLFKHSERYVRQVAEARGWATDRALPSEVRTFWSTALGAVLLFGAGVSGTTADLDLAGTLTIHEIAGTSDGPAAGGVRG
ncbi:TetR/AcrR family transcriptional regulator C-terminal domain-containing protein [Agromyces sp. MMS24-JH15]|uniref:TetR/AcrR family transcriptional regulator C-terminal domain-containing protein n=1 Tax=Agromyces sp. MMS24-JH15 TaxID=3243765 RepID=UPI003748E085